MCVVLVVLNFPMAQKNVADGSAILSVNHVSIYSLSEGKEELEDGHLQ